MIDHAKGAKPYEDIDRRGPMAHDLPHRYLPLPDGYEGRGSTDDGACCQFTAGGLRCQGTRGEHRSKWPELAR